MQCSEAAVAYIFGKYKSFARMLESAPAPPPPPPHRAHLSRIRPAKLKVWRPLH